MRKLTFVFVLLVLLLTVPGDRAAGAGATCIGANPCKACKNCKYCRHCAKDGRTCGVCKPTQ